jgi:hypothetical protein
MHLLDYCIYFINEKCTEHRATKFFDTYRNQDFIAVVKRARYWVHSSGSGSRSAPSHKISVNLIHYFYF